jgi:hypothetical protein
MVIFYNVNRKKIAKITVKQRLNQHINFIKSIKKK